MSNSTFVASGDVPGLSPFGVRRSVRRVVAGHDVQKWIQQCLSFELIENLGTPSSPGFGRCIRISTAGTLVSTASYRTDNKAASLDPYTWAVADQLDRMGKDEASDVADNRLVLDQVHLTIEAITASGNDVNAGQDWILIDAAPLTKNNQRMVGTSTSLGFNAGVFGDAATAGVDFSMATSHEWSLPDYDLLLVGAKGLEGQPRVTWEVKRSDPVSDPNVARSSFQPHFEAVFGLRSNAIPRRYSAITTMMTVGFYPISQDQQSTYMNTLRGKVEAARTNQVVSTLEILGQDAMMVLSPGAYYAELAKSAKANANDAENLYITALLNRHSFMMTFIVDWKNGTVHAYTPDSQDRYGLPKLSGISDVSGSKGDHGDLEQRLVQQKTDLKLMDAATAKKLLNPEVPKEENIAELRMEFSDGSAAGVVNHDVGPDFAGGSTKPKTYDVRFPIDALASYADRFVIYKGYPKAESVQDSQWIPFKRAARINVQKDPGLIWTALDGYSRDNVWVIDPKAKPTQLRTADILGLPEAPDAWYRTKHKDPTTSKESECDLLAWRDRIFVSDTSGWTSFKSCFGGLTSAIFGDQLSLGIAYGKVVASTDYFKTPSSLSKVKTKVAVSGKTKDVPLEQALNDFIYGGVNVWMFLVDGEAVVVAGEQVACFRLPEIVAQDSGGGELSVTLTVSNWKALVDRWSSQQGEDCKAVAAILARTGIQKPISGYAAIPTDGGWLAPGHGLDFNHGLTLIAQKAG